MHIIDSAHDLPGQARKKSLNQRKHPNRRKSCRDWAVDGNGFYKTRLL